MCLLENKASTRLNGRSADRVVVFMLIDTERVEKAIVCVLVKESDMLWYDKPRKQKTKPSRRHEICDEIIGQLRQ